VCVYSRIALVRAWLLALCTCICIHAFIRIYTCENAYIHLHIYTHSYIHTRTYLHTQDGSGVGMAGGCIFFTRPHCFRSRGISMSPIKRALCTLKRALLKEPYIHSREPYIRSKAILACLVVVLFLQDLTVSDPGVFQ